MTALLGWVIEGNVIPRWTSAAFWCRYLQSCYLCRRVIAETGVQYISCGALTHSVTALDISLNIETR